MQYAILIIQFILTPILTFATVYYSTSIKADKIGDVVTDINHTLQGVEL